MTPPPILGQDDLIECLRWAAFKMYGAGEHETFASDAITMAIDLIEDLRQPKTVTFTVVSAADGNPMHTFKIDPSKKTILRPLHSMIGYVFEPEVVEYGRIHTDGSRSGGQPIVKTQHCPNCETNARAAERWRVRAERWRVRADQHNDECERMGIKGQAIIDQLSAENERLREAIEQIAFSGADGPYGHFGEALNEYQMRSLAQAAYYRSKANDR